MIVMPDESKKWEYENAYFLTSNSNRLSKVLAQHELFKKALMVPGHIVECGVFKGASLFRLVNLYQIYEKTFPSIREKKIIAFDIFGRFPEATLPSDIVAREKFIQEAGSESIDVDQLKSILKRRGALDFVELVSGDISKTFPDYFNSPKSISYLNMDVDLYEPTAAVLKYGFPLMSPGGVLALDNYLTFPGEKKAVDEYFALQKGSIQSLEYFSQFFFVQK